MRQKSMSKNDPAERTVRDIRRKTRKQYSAEEKIRIVVSGLPGEESIAALCRPPRASPRVCITAGRKSFWKRARSGVTCAIMCQAGKGYSLWLCALAEIIQGRMAEAVDDWLDSLDGSAMRDRRTGSYSRHLLTELGDIELSVPRTRRFCPSEVLRSYARRAPEIDRAILAGVVLGLSTRKVGEVLLARLGRKVSASTVSRVAKTLDEAVAAFHARPLADTLQRRSCSTAWCWRAGPAPAR